jgi:hypothetical protein
VRSQYFNSKSRDVDRQVVDDPDELPGGEFGLTDLDVRYPAE